MISLYLLCLHIICVILHIGILLFVVQGVQSKN